MHATHTHLMTDNYCCGCRRRQWSTIPSGSTCTTALRSPCQHTMYRGCPIATSLLRNSSTRLLNNLLFCSTRSIAHALTARLVQRARQHDCRTASVAPTAPMKNYYTIIRARISVKQAKQDVNKLSEALGSWFLVLGTCCSMAHASYQKPEFAFDFCWFGGF